MSTQLVLNKYNTNYEALGWLTQTDPKTAAPGTGTGAPQLDQRLLTNTRPKQCTKSKHTNKH